MIFLFDRLAFGYRFDARSSSLGGGEFFPKGVAIFSYYNERVLKLDITRFFIGLAEDNAFGLSCVFPFRRHGTLIFNGEVLSSEGFSLYEFSMGYAARKRIFSRLFFGIGISVGLDGVSYDRDVFHNVDPYDPVFAGSLSKQDIALDAGLSVSYSSIMLAATLVNLRQPSLSLVGSPLGRMPRSMLVTGLIPISGKLIISGTLDYSDNLFPVYGFGVERLFGENLAARVGSRFNKNGISELSAGFGISWHKINFDYAFNLPCSEPLLRSGTSNHHLSISYRWSLPPVFSDITVSSLNIAEKHIVEHDLLKYTFEIANVGKGGSDPFYVHLWTYPDSQNTARVFFVPSGLKEGERISFSGELFAHRADRYALYVFADPEGAVKEKNRTNNAFVDSFVVSKGISGKLELSFSRLELEELTYLVEEQPVIPVVFFEPNKAEIDPRFHSLLELISSRMRLNPDVRLKLYGYVDTTSDSASWLVDNLHLRRARAVKEFLVSSGVEQSKIEVVENGYLPYAVRAGRRFESIPLYHRPLVADENRRVELVAYIPQFDKPFKVVKALSPEKMVIKDLQKLLHRNQDIIIILKGYGSEDAPYRKLRELEILRDSIVASDSISDERTAILLSYAENETIYVFPSADAMLYHPTKIRFSEFKGLEKSKEVNEIKISVFSDFPVDTYKIEIIDNENNVVRHIVGGNGMPPKSVKWDWYDETGNIVTPDRKYLCRLKLRDIRGNERYIFSDTMDVFVTKKEVRREHLIIVEFIFDEVISLSDYLESRIFFLAREISRRIRNYKIPRSIVIVGHTDVIGDDARNLVLSEERALKEANYLRILLTFMNSLGSKEQFFNWLSKGRIKWDVRGVGSSEPLVVKSFKNGILSFRTIGDDFLPEGRSVNRRVVLELEEVIKNVK